MWIARRVIGVEVINIIKLWRHPRVREAAALIVVAERVDEDVERVGDRFREVSEVGVKRVWEGQDPLTIAERGDHLLALT